jgi:hypothetical protein
LLICAQINSRTLNWGPALRVRVISLPPTIQLLSPPAIAGGQIQLDFTVANYSSGMTFQLWKTPGLDTAFTQDTSAALSTLIPNLKFRFTTPTGSAPRGFYRVSGN